ncbi:hypothetical protein MBLNU230_g0753t1 [Neophaeotheca triangularis]
MAGRGAGMAGRNPNPPLQGFVEFCRARDRWITAQIEDGRKEAKDFVRNNILLDWNSTGITQPLAAEAKIAFEQWAKCIKARDEGMKKHNELIDNGKTPGKKQLLSLANATTALRNAQMPVKTLLEKCKRESVGHLLQYLEDIGQELDEESGEFKEMISDVDKPGMLRKFKIGKVGREGQKAKAARKRAEDQKKKKIKGVKKPNARKSTFKDAQPNVGTGWDTTYQKGVGDGAMGSCVSWVRLDEHKRICDNVVVKEVPCTDSYWTKDSTWYKAVSAIDKDWDEMAVEAAALKLAEARAASQGVNGDCVVKFRGYSVNEAEKTFRIYMEYCGFGDLAQVYLRHKKLVEDGNGYVPEAAVWWVLESLARACVLLQSGGSPDELNDLEVMHLDLKPMNIILGLPQKDKWVGWPTPKMTDFGLAKVTTANDPKNPGKYRDAGTNLFKAPEQISNQPEGKEGQRMSEKTNVWGIGKIAVAMMELECHDLLFFKGDDYLPSDLGRKWEISKIAPFKYSDELVETVRKCLAYDARKRWSPEELLKEIDSRIKSDGVMNKLRTSKNMKDRDFPMIHLPLGNTTGVDDLYRNDIQMGLVYKDAPGAGQKKGGKSEGPFRKDADGDAKMGDDVSAVGGA